MDEKTAKFLNKIYVLSAILVLGVLIFFVGEIIYQQMWLGQQNANQITVSGEGKVYAKPDVALVTLGVTTQGTTVADVTKTNTSEMNTIIDAVKALKIDDKDIQTTNYNLSPQYNWTEKQGNVFQGYTLEQDVQVKIRDFTKIGDVLSVATTNGANLVGNLQFTVDNPEQFREQARAFAIAQAKLNANNLAKESGISLGKLINVIEGNENPSPMRFSNAIMASETAAPSAEIPTVQPGQQEIDVTISLTYQVR